MLKCPSCGAPDPGPICWCCGHETVIDDPQPAAEEPTHGPEAAVPNSVSVDEPAATVRDSTPRLWLAASAAGFVITLLVVGLADRVRQPAVQPGPAVQTALAPSSRSGAPVLAEPPTWVGRRQAVWTSDGSRSIAFGLDPIDDAPVWTSRGRPQLVVRCLSRRADVYVVTGPLSFEGDEGRHTVRVQVDEEPEQSQEWLDSESSQELFAPDGGLLSDRLALARRLRFTYTPFNSRPITLEFAVAGFDQLAPLVARTCGRRPSLPSR